MATTNVQFGSRGFPVAKLQLQLNLKKALIPLLEVDGIFGPLTQNAVKAFQRKQGLVPDGIAGPLTQAAASEGLSITAVDHGLKLITQPTPTTCWAASTASMTHSTVAAVKAKTPADMINADGSLNNSSGTDQAVVTGERFATIHGLHCFPPMTWKVSAFLALLKRSPVMVDMLWKSSEYAAGSNSPGHMVVVTAVVSDNDENGEKTYVEILNPLPPNVGHVSWEEYSWWINMLPTRTYRTFTK